jgi:hypothetical protein
MISFFKKRKAKECSWKGSGWASIHKTDCGHEFHDSSETGNPVTDWLTFCPYCGNRVTTDGDS